MLDKAPSRVAAMFDAIAARYDFLNHFLSAGFDRAWRVRAIRSLRLTGRERLLDVCSGTGDMAIAAVRAGQRGAAAVVGVDFSANMLRVGVEKTRRARLDDRIAFVRGDAVRLPVRTAAVDAVAAAFGIRNVEQPERAMAEMFRVLKPGGRLAILEFSIPRSPVVRALYLPYFRHVLPRLGGLISGHGGAYTYLPASVGAFIEPETMAGMLERCGFGQVRTRGLTLGIVTLYEAVRSPAAPR